MTTEARVRTVYHQSAQKGKKFEWVEPLLDPSKKYTLFDVHKQTGRAIQVQPNAMSLAGPLTFLCMSEWPSDDPVALVFEVSEWPDGSPFAQPEPPIPLPIVKIQAKELTTSEVSVHEVVLEGENTVDRGANFLYANKQINGVRLVDFAVRNSRIEVQKSRLALARQKLLEEFVVVVPAGYEVVFADPRQSQCVSRRECDYRGVQSIAYTLAPPKAAHMIAGGEVIVRFAVCAEGDAANGYYHVRRMHIALSGQWNSPSASPAFDSAPSAIPQAVSAAWKDAEGDFLSALMTNTPYPYKKSKPHDGWSCFWGDPYQGMTGGEEIMQCHAMALMRGAGGPLSIGALMLQNAYIRRRDAAAWTDSADVRLDPYIDGHQGLGLTVWSGNIRKCDPFPLLYPDGGTSDWNETVSSGKIVGDGYDDRWQRYDMQHKIRGMYTSHTLFWLTGDALAREQCLEHSAMARFEWSFDHRLGGQALVAEIRAKAPATTGKGIGYGRELGHALCAVGYGLAATPPANTALRVHQQMWIRRMLEMCKSATTPLGTPMAKGQENKNWKYLNNPNWLMAQPYEHGIFLRGAAIAHASLPFVDADVAETDLQFFLRWALFFEYTASTSGPYDCQQIGSVQIKGEPEMYPPQAGYGSNDQQIGALVYPLFVIERWARDSESSTREKIRSLIAFYVGLNPNASWKHIREAIEAKPVFYWDRRMHVLAAVAGIEEQESAQ